MTLTDSLPLADTELPTTRAGIEAWLDARVEEAARLTRKRLRAIVVGSYEAFITSLTAAGDLTRLDAIPAQWLAFVDGELAPFIGETHLTGSLQAWVGQSIEPHHVFAKAWADVVNENAVSWQAQASNRLANVGTATWQHVRAQTVDALNRGLTNEELKGRIEGVTGFSELRADTIARTETVSAYVNGDMTGARALGEHGPVEKVWVTAGDHRVRSTHQEAHNQVRKLAEPFDVGGVQMDSPHAPGAPAGEVVNCRCYTELLYPGDTRPDGTEVGAVPGTPAAVERSQLARDVDEMRAELMRGRPGSMFDYYERTDIGAPRKGKPSKQLKASEVQIRKIGARVDTEVTGALERRGLHEPMGLRKRVAAASDASADRFPQAALDYARTEGYTGDSWRDWYMDRDPPIDLDELRRRAQALDPEYARLTQVRDELQAIPRLTPEEYARVYSEELRARLAEVRPMGRVVDFQQGTHAPFDSNAGNQQRPSLPPVSSHAQQVADTAVEWYPADWNATTGLDGDVWIGDVNGVDERGYQITVRDNKATIHIPFMRQNDLGLIVHEYGHRIESMNVDVTAHEFAFLARRKGRESVPKRLSTLTGNRKYRATEVAFKDEFVEAYMGKVYNFAADSNYEVLSMGMEGITTGRFGMYTDDDYRSFIIGLLAGL